MGDCKNVYDEQKGELVEANDDEAVGVDGHVESVTASSEGYFQINLRDSHRNVTLKMWRT